jgi:hypothetical protein
MWGVKDPCASMSVATFAETVEGEVRWVVQNSSFKIQDCQTTVIAIDRFRQWTRTYDIVTDSIDRTSSTEIDPTARSGYLPIDLDRSPAYLQREPWRSGYPKTIPTQVFWCDVYHNFPGNDRLQHSALSLPGSR